MRFYRSKLFQKACFKNLFSTCYQNFQIPCKKCERFVNQEEKLFIAVMTKSAKAIRNVFRSLIDISL